MFSRAARNPRPQQSTGILKRAVFYLMRALPERYLVTMNRLIRQNGSDRLKLSAAPSKPQRSTSPDYLHQQVQDNISEILD